MSRLTPLLLLGLLGCPASDDAPADDTDTDAVVTFADVQAQVFDPAEPPSCTTGCHDAEHAQGGLDLTGPDAWEQLINAPCDNEIAVVEGLVRVAEGDPEGSFLWIKLTEPQGMGDVMPPFGRLDDDQLDLVRRWIEQGALP